ncbi:MAG: formate dehydrogenase N subunit beta transmembrane domain-containing protein [Thermoanaerobaculia bacterium]
MPWGVKLWKKIVRPLGVIAAAAAVIGVFGHYTAFGPKEVPEREEERTQP